MDNKTIADIMNFMGGIIYAIDGVVVGVSHNTYMFLPNGIEVERDEDNEVYTDMFTAAGAQAAEAAAQQARPTGAPQDVSAFGMRPGIVKLKEK